MEKAKQYRKNDAALQPRRFDVLRFLREKVLDGTAGGVLLCLFLAAADALAHDRALLEAVERGRIVFIMDHREGGIVGRKDLLRLAFIHHFELLSHG